MHRVWPVSVPKPKRLGAPAPGHGTVTGHTGRPRKDMDKLSARSLRRRVQERNERDPPIQIPGHDHTQWDYLPLVSCERRAKIGKWQVVRSPQQRVHWIAQRAYFRQLQRQGLHRFLKDRAVLHMPMDVMRRDRDTFWTKYEVSPERASACLSAVRAPSADHLTVPTPLRHNGSMAMAHFDSREEIEGIFDLQRKLPAGTPGHLPKLTGEHQRELLWSVDHARRCEPIGIWTLKELAPDPADVAHHRLECIVVACHVGAERKDQLEVWNRYCSMSWVQREFATATGPTGTPVRNILCVDQKAFEKLFDISPANMYGQCPNKKPCLYCDRTHSEVRQWNNTVNVHQRRRSPVRTWTIFEPEDCCPDYLLHGNRNWWHQALDGAHCFLKEQECALDLVVFQNALEVFIDPLLRADAPAVSWEAADKLLEFDWTGVDWSECEPTFWLTVDGELHTYTQSDLVVELFRSWQEMWHLANSDRHPTADDQWRMGKLAHIQREVIAIFVPRGMNPTIWVHTIAYHMEHHMEQFGNLRRLGLWGQEAKHKDYRRKFHSGPLKSSAALAYGLEMQRVEYKLRAGRVQEVERKLSHFPKYYRRPKYNQEPPLSASIVDGRCVLLRSPLVLFCAHGHPPP